MDRSHPEQQPVGSVAPACVGLVLEAAGSLAVPAGGMGASGGLDWDLIWLCPHHKPTEGLFLFHFAHDKTKAQ